MDANDFFFTLAERRFLEPEPEKKVGPHCIRCGRAIDAWEFKTGGAALLNQGAVCRKCANIRIEGGKKMQGKLNAEQKRLVEDNLGLVHGVLKRMGMKKDYEDFFSIGCIGLCKAALCWETGKLPFSTYATHFVKHELINQLKYTHCSKRSSAAVQPFEDTNERLSAFDIGFERAQTRVMLRELQKNLDEMLGSGDAEVIRLLAQGRSPQQAAQALHMSLTAVYNARVWAWQRLKDWINE